MKRLIYDYFNYTVTGFPLSEKSKCNSIRFDFVGVDLMVVKEIAHVIINEAITSDKFWVCLYGVGTFNDLLELNLFSNYKDTVNINLEKPFIDEVWYEAESNSVFCIFVSKTDFNFWRFIEYALFHGNLSDVLFLVDISTGTCINFYDRRGMLILSESLNVVESLQNKHSTFVCEFIRCVK